jgi:hypothetical protein
MTNSIAFQPIFSPNLLFTTSSSGDDFHPEFESLIDDNTDDESYFDPSRHDLTQDSNDPQEDCNRSKRRDLFCFHCNRMESHAPALRYRWQYSFLIGMTLGLIKLLGPYFCRCCGHRRFIGSDRFNPKYLLYQMRLRRHSKRRRSRR